jgi:hypothetical protein
MRLDLPPCQAPLFCDRLLLVKKQAMRRAKQQSLPVIPSFELSSACDALPVKALLQATRPGWATELAQQKRWQVRLRKRE